MTLARRILTAATGILVLGLSVLGGVSAASADVDDFSFSSMTADYTIARAADGTSELRVVETFVAEFPETDQNHGMRRRVPDEAFGQPLDPQFVSVTDEDGAPRASEVEDEDGELVITSRADDFVHGSQTYVITYTLRNVTPIFALSGTQEFYWNVNGVDWAQPFGRVTARLHVPAELADTLTGEVACYQGGAGETTPCASVATTPDGDGATVTAEATDLGPGQTLTFATGFTPGTFATFDPSYAASPWGWAQAVASVGVVVALVWGIAVRRRHLRDGRGRPTIIAEYTPPADVDALEAAVLLGRPAKAIPAEVLEQAVAGSIRIVEGERGWFGRAPFEAHLQDRSRADGDGRMLLDGLFGEDAAPGAVFVFGRQDTRFSKAAQAILKEAGADLVAKGLRRTVPARYRVGPIVLSVLAAAGVAVFGALALDANVIPWVPIVIIIAAALVCVLTVGLVARTPLSDRGAETRDHLAGLREFIAWAEEDRIRMLQSPTTAEREPIDTGDPRQVLRIYERLLPYAVVFGQEKQWAERLAVLYGDGGSPSWYSGTTAFSAASFASSVGSLSVSATSSSGSGGSTGGGSAGGGGGGGGGGGV